MIDPATFLSGETGHVAGVRRTVARTLGDALFDGRLAVRGTGGRLDRMADAVPSRDVLVLGIYRADSQLMEDAVRELRATRHGVRFALGATGEPRASLADETVASGLSGGKFQNLNLLLTEPGAWTLVVDDDVALPPRFLDRFLGLAEAFDLAMAQPAQSLRSHAAWRVTRRRFGSLVRETRFVEIGPVTAFRHDAAGELLPFPDLRFGWGLDLHWAAVAGERGWKMGIADALPVRHETLPVAASYGHQEAIEEAQLFLADRPYVDSATAQQTLAVHR